MSSNNFVKGISLGLVVGSAVGIVLAPHKKNSRSMLGKTIKTFGEVLENLTDSVL